MQKFWQLEYGMGYIDTERIVNFLEEYYSIGRSGSEIQSLHEPE